MAWFDQAARATVQTTLERMLDLLNVSPTDRATKRRWRLVADIHSLPYDEVVVGEKTGGKFPSLAPSYRPDRENNSYIRGVVMEKLPMGLVLVVGVILAGCSKQPERSAIQSASAVEVDKDDGLASEIDADNVEPATDKVNHKAVAHFEAGIAAYEANDLPLANQEFLAAAKEGHADSQFNLGVMYEHGVGVGKDENEAVDWYAKSAEQGNAAAQFNLGVLYENGRGTEVNFAKANEWYRKASVQGDALAVGNLGMLYVRGQGVKENKIAGVALLILSSTEDPSPENHAKQNITATRGLTSEMVVKAQALAEKLSSAPNLLVPLDQFLKESENRTENN